MNLFDWSFDKINTDSNNQKNGNILSNNQPAMEQFFFWCSFYLSCKTFFSMCETLKNNVFTGDFVIFYLSSQLKKKMNFWLLKCICLLRKMLFSQVKFFIYFYSVEPSKKTPVIFFHLLSRVKLFFFSEKVGISRNCILTLPSTFLLFFSLSSYWK